MNWYKKSQIETKDLIEKQNEEIKQREIKKNISQIEDLQETINEREKHTLYWEKKGNESSKQIEQLNLKINEEERKNGFYSSRNLRNLKNKLKKELSKQQHSYGMLGQSQTTLYHLKEELKALKEKIKANYNRNYNISPQKKQLKVKQIQNQNLKEEIKWIIIEAMKRMPTITSMKGQNYRMNNILMPSVKSINKTMIKIDLLTQMDQPRQKQITDEAISSNLTPETILNDLITSFMHSNLHEIIYPIKQKLGVDRVILTAYGQYNNPIEVIK